MKWTIEKSRFDATYLMVNTIFNPKNDPLRYCLAQIKIINYPDFISSQSKSMSYGEEYVHIKNFSDMTWEDKAWASKVKGSALITSEMFLVHDYIGETIIDEDVFNKILHDYGSTLIEVYRNDNSLPNLWNIEMAQALKKLKTKIDTLGPI